MDQFLYAFLDEILMLVIFSLIAFSVMITSCLLRILLTTFGQDYTTFQSKLYHVLSDLDQFPFLLLFFSQVCPIFCCECTRLCQNYEVFGLRDTFLFTVVFFVGITFF